MENGGAPGLGVHTGDQGLAAYDAVSPGTTLSWEGLRQVVRAPENRGSLNEQSQQDGQTVLKKVWGDLRGTGN